MILQTGGFAVSDIMTRSNSKSCARRTASRVSTMPT